MTTHDQYPVVLCFSAKCLSEHHLYNSCRCDKPRQTDFESSHLDLLVVNSKLETRVLVEGVSAGNLSVAGSDAPVIKQEKEVRSLGGILS